MVINEYRCIRSSLCRVGLAAMLAMLLGWGASCRFAVVSRPEHLPPPLDIDSGEVIRSKYVRIDDIVFHFDDLYHVGRFANGDWWVRGPVQITAISPDYRDRRNGWEVNPLVDGPQGFDAGAAGGQFDPSLIPDLPFDADPSGGILSIVKTVSTGNARPAVKSAVVLTVVDQPPAENGRAVFRPPYVGTVKPYYLVADLDTELLPALVPLAEMPSYADIAGYYSRLQMDHKRGLLGRAMRPADNMRDYQPANTPAQSNAALRLMIAPEAGQEDERLAALINFVQFGIDKIHMLYLGQTWPDGGGHQPGHRLAPAFAAVLLDLPEAKELLTQATFFHGSRCFVPSNTRSAAGSSTAGITLWGVGVTNPEASYWNYIANNSGNRSIKDPYGFIDGGDLREGAYQHITAQAHKGEILATHLMPQLKEAWNPAEWQALRCYTDRWVMLGRWAAPDPVAAFDANRDNRGVTWGEDPQNTGQAIAGSGRFPEAHGRFRDEGQYRSNFVAAMWDEYRTAAPCADQSLPFVVITSPLATERPARPFVCRISAFSIHGIQRIEVLVDGQLAGTITEADDEHPAFFSLELDLNPAALVIEAIAYDQHGRSNRSSTIATGE